VHGKRIGSFQGERRPEEIRVAGAESVWVGCARIRVEGRRDLCIDVYPDKGKFLAKAGDRIDDARFFPYRNEKLGAKIADVLLRIEILFNGVEGPLRDL